MSTSWAEVITNYAMVEIDDQRLTDILAANPAQFFRRMALYFQLALPLFNRPPQIRQYLATGMVKPIFSDFEWISTDLSATEPTTIATGEIGYDLFSCSLIETDGAGNAVYTPCSGITYDPLTGNVTFPIQSATGLDYTIDFYTDGSFTNDLTDTQLRILGLCIAAVWNERFTGNWLNMQLKINDKSFYTAAESAYITAATGRLQAVRSNLTAELQKYEFDCEVNSIASLSNRPIVFI